MLAALGKDDYVVALEIAAKTMNTEQLSAWLAERMRDGRSLAFLIGGPDGLSPPCLERADQSWSLSPLTLPHALVRSWWPNSSTAPRVCCRAPLSPRLSTLVRYPGYMSLDFVYLASGSPRRRELLQQIGVSCRVVGTAVDEAVQSAETAPTYVLRLAAAKAEAGWVRSRDGKHVRIGGRHRGGSGWKDTRQAG